MSAVPENDIILRYSLCSVGIRQPRSSAVERVEDNPVATPCLDTAAPIGLEIAPREVVRDINVGAGGPVSLHRLKDADRVVTLSASLDGVVRDVADDRDIVHTGVSQAVSDKPAGLASVGYIVREYDVMNIHPVRVGRSDSKAEAVGAIGDVHLPTLDAPETVVDIDSFIVRPDLAGIEGVALQPRDVVPTRAVHVAPMT